MHSWRWPDTPGVRALGLGVAAIQYAEMGYRVLPLERGGKKPHHMLPYGGVHNATADRESIWMWWMADPAASIGVACGNGLAVIDLDCKAADGISAFRDFLRGAPPFPPAPYAGTPSGGYHIWLRGDLPERPGILAGVDIKGAGGLVVAPPSMRLVMPDGRDGERVEQVPVPYRWLAGCPCALPDAPGWLADWAATAAPARDPVRGQVTGQEPDQLEHGIPRGQRNAGFYRMACSLYRQFGTSPAGAEQVLRRIRAMWEAGDRTDFGWREVLTCCESARRFIDRDTGRERRMRASWLAGARWLDRHG